MKSPVQTVVVIESVYKPFSHYPILTRALQLVCAESGVKYLSLYPKGSQLGEGIDPDWFRSVLPPQPRPYTAWNRLVYFARFCGCLLSYPFPPQSLVFWPTALPEEMAASLLLAVLRPRSSSHLLVSHLACQTFRQRWISPGIWALRWARVIKKVLPNLPWTCWAASHAFQKDLESVYVGRLDVAPQTVFNPMASRPAAQSAECRFVSAGQPRRTKGFPLLVEVLYMLRDWLQDGRIAFTIQVAGADEDGELTRASYRRLCEDPLPNVHLVDSFVTAQQYEEMLLDSHFGVLPYDPAHYAYYPSGVLHDCLAAGRPVITTRGTLSAEKIDKNGAGLVCEYSAEALKEAIISASQNREELLAKAWSNSPDWNREHSPTALLEAMFQVVSKP